MNDFKSVDITRRDQGQCTQQNQGGSDVFISPDVRKNSYHKLNISVFIIFRNLWRSENQPGNLLVKKESLLNIFHKLLSSGRVGCMLLPGLLCIFSRRLCSSGCCPCTEETSLRSILLHCRTSRKYPGELNLSRYKHFWALLRFPA